MSEHQSLLIPYVKILMLFLGSRPFLNLIMNNKRWLRYGLVGNLLFYGIGTAFLAYMGWLIYEIGESSSAKMDEDLAKEVFTFTQAELKESAKRAKTKFLLQKEESLRKQRERSQARMEANKKAEYL